MFILPLSQCNACNTFPSAPTPLRMLTTAGNTTSSSVELNWLPPLHPNGATHYEIEYEPAMSPGDTVNAGNSSTPHFTLTLPSEFVTYNVRVAAVNTQGLGSVQSINISVCLGRNREEGVCFACNIITIYTILRYLL